VKKTFAYADIRTNEEYNKTISSSRIDFAFQNIFYAKPDYSVQFSGKKSEEKVREKFTKIIGTKHARVDCIWITRGVTL